MKVAVTGATGFLGKYLVNYLSYLQYEVIVISRPLENARQIFNDNVAVIEGDFGVEHLRNSFQGVDTVIHLAAQTMQRDSHPYKLSQFFDVNMQIIENILVAADETDVKRICQMSSNNVYSSANTIPFTEIELPVPSSIYGVSKLSAEILGNYYASKTGKSVINLRLARLFGYGERDSVVFTKYMNLARTKQRLEVWGEGKTKIEYIYVKDAVTAIEAILRASKKHSGTYNVGTNRSYSVLEIAKAINKVCNNDGNLFIDSAKQESYYHILMDSSSFYKAFEWKPEWELEKAIEDICKYYEKHV